MIIGSHCAMNGALMMEGSVKEALSYGANALMIYTGAPQSTIRRPLKELHIEEALKLMEENNIKRESLIIHAPYIMNPATSDLEKRDFCINFLAEEIKRSEAMGAKTIVLHPGNAMGQPTDIAIENISIVLNTVIALTASSNVCIALETMAGKGSEVGRTFSEIEKIIELVINKDRIGVCLDTCHIFDGGYDIINDYENVINEFDRVIGINKLKVIHVNDSKNVLGSHKDRHANIGTGNIGFTPLYKICHDERFINVPKILETPYIDGFAPYKEEICKLKK